MSSTSTPPAPGEGPIVRKIKKKRLPGACDECRRKKAKCDSAQMPGNSCTNCASFDIQCTHDLPRRKQKTETEMSIPVLHARIRKLEDFIRRLYPDEDIDVILNLQPEHTPPPHGGAKYAIPRSMSPDSPPLIKEEENSVLPDEDDLAPVALAEHLGRLSVNPIDDRYFGPASAFMFAKHVSMVRCEAMGKPYEPTDPKKHRRRMYWDIRPWEMAYSATPEPPYVYPDHDLLLSLVSYYFENSNNLIPILHRPSFMKSLTCGQHHWDPSFGMTVLLVCALGSRYSHDVRVQVANDESGLSAGWNYFTQVPLHRKMMFYKSTIYDLQYYALASLYLVGSCIPNATWHILGVGLRHALEKGIHRRTGPPTVESEMQKRAFWALVCLDRLGCSFVGRPSGYPHEIFDVEYPIECDDEYWEPNDPEMAFQQPPGKPCQITAFISFIKLCEILSFVLRTLYTNKKSKIQAGYVGHEWEIRMVAELDSSMNKWKESLPEYLRWDPKRQNPVFFKQTVSLHATYYHIQIQIHRQFLSKQSALSFSSLAVCTNAARSCAHLLEVAGTREFFVMPNIMTAAFISGVVISLNLWGNQRSGYITDTEEEVKNFKRCVNFLERSESRWNQAGRFIDMLREVSSLDDYEPTARKRRRPTSPGPDILLSSKRVYRDPHNHSFGQPIITPTVNLNVAAFGGGGYSNPDFHSLQAMNSTYTTQSMGVSAAAVVDANNVQQSSPYVFEFPSGNDMFALWDDLPTTFTSIEEWEAYSLSVGLTQP